MKVQPAVFSSKSRKWLFIRSCIVDDRSCWFSFCSAYSAFLLLLRVAAAAVLLLPAAAAAAAAAVATSAAAIPLLLQLLLLLCLLFFFEIIRVCTIMICLEPRVCMVLLSCLLAVLYRQTIHVVLHDHSIADWTTAGIEVAPNYHQSLVIIE